MFYIGRQKKALVKQFFTHYIIVLVNFQGKYLFFLWSRPTIKSRPSIFFPAFYDCTTVRWKFRISENISSNDSTVWQLGLTILWLLQRLVEDQNYRCSVARRKETKWSRLKVIRRTAKLFFGYYGLWQYGLLNFEVEDIKLEIFLPKNQHTQRKLLIFFCRDWFYEVKYLCFLFN